MKNIKFTLILLVSICGFKTINAQDTTQNIKNSIAIIGKYSGNKIVLRWAPSTSAAFSVLKNYGYQIEKAMISKDKKFFKANWKSIGKFKPADSLTWAKRVDTSSAYQVIAAHCAFAKINAPLPANPNFDEIVNRSNEEKNIHGFALVSADFDTTAANLLGLRFEDRDIEQNAVYAYRIKSLAPESILKIAGSETFVLTEKEDEMIPPSLEEFGLERTILINWYNQLHKNYFTGYYLEKGDAKGQNFKRLNKNPMTRLYDPSNPRGQDLFMYKDSVDKDYVVYSYRLIGINAFGELSEPGPVAYSYGRDRTAPEAAYEVTATDALGKYLDIKWKKDVYEKDFAGFNVLRSNNYNGPFEILNEKILPKGTLSFLDKKPDAMAGGYYKIEALDTAGNQGWSLGVHGFLVDSIPPAKPKGLTGTIDTNGVVTLRWNLGPEQDIKGYRIYYANQIDHEFTVLTGYLHQDTVFTDTISLKTMTEDIFYQIAASDRHYNHSERSEVLKLHKPDTIAPVKPMFANVLVTDTAVYLSWIPSSSLDVIKHNIYRKMGEGQFTLWKTIDGNMATQLIDKDVKIGQIYTYKIEAIDDVNNSSGFPAEVSGKIYDVGKRAAIKNVKVTYNKETKRNNITWEYPKSDKYHYVIYRSYNQSTFRVYKSVDGDKLTFEDYDLLGKGTYTYAIMAFYKDGGSSGLSDKVVVEVR